MYVYVFLWIKMQKSLNGIIDKIPKALTVIRGRYARDVLAEEGALEDIF